MLETKCNKMWKLGCIMFLPVASVWRLLLHDKHLKEFLPACIMRGLVKCIVRGCKDKSSHRLRLPHPISDLNNRFSKWLELAGYGGVEGINPLVIYKNKRICDQHFSPSCYVEGSKTLKRDAMPDTHLPVSHSRGDSPQPGPSQKVTPPRDGGTSTYIDIVSNVEPLEGVSWLETSEPEDSSTTTIDITSEAGLIPGRTTPEAEESSTAGVNDPAQPPPKRRAIARSRVQGMEGVLRRIGVRKAAELTPKAKHLYDTAKRFQRSIHRSSKKLGSFKKRLQAAEKTLNVCPEASFKGLPRTLSTFLQCQLRETSKKSKGHRFSLEYKVWALSLLKKSGRAYDYLSKWFVLPSRRTLLRLLSCLSFSTGINNEMFDYLSLTIRKKVSEIDRHCILMFDEMSLSPQLTFVEHLDFIEGFQDLGGGDRAPRFADKALVFMVRGLSRSYKQPVAYVFPSGTIKTPDLSKLIKAVISKLSHSGLKVCATVCDQGATNVAAIANLCSETRESVLRSGGEYRGDYFSVDGVEVIPLFDPPHLLKGLRNVLLTKDLKFSQQGVNKTATWRHILQFYAIDHRTQRAVPNLTDFHVVPEKIKKMKVCYCTQVFSQRLSSVMGLLASKNVPGLDPKAEETADLLSFLDSLFDSVNGKSRQPPPNKPLRCSVSSSSGHMEFWSEALRVLESMTYTDGVKDYGTPSIKNWVRTLRNMRALWLRLKSNGFKYLSPRNLNQDPLENKFGSIRSYGFRNINPTCNNFVGAYKALLLNDMVAAHSLGANCEEDDCEVLDNLRNYLLSSRLSSTTSSSAPGEFPTALGDDPVVTRCPLEMSSTMEFDAWPAADMLRRLGPVHCPHCHAKQHTTHHTPSPEFVNILKKSIALLQEHLPAISFKLGVGAHLKHILINSINVVTIACDEHLHTYASRFCATVVTAVVTSWCNSVNRYLKGKHTSHSQHKDTIHEQAHLYYTKRRHVR